VGIELQTEVKEGACMTAVFMNLLSILILMTPFTPIQAQAQARAHASSGTVGGGGGEPLEMTVDLIRADILTWIQNDGAETFQTWPSGMTPEVYKKQMRVFLEPHAVTVGFVNSQQEQETTDPEQKVVVDGQPKACRGFLSKKDQKPHILCSTERFPKSVSAQYRLIHHEYAGLAGVERNQGASSDYTLSNQLTDSLEAETVYRLAVKDINPHGPLVMTSPDAGRVEYTDTCSNGGNNDAEMRNHFVQTSLKNPQSKLARLKAQLLKEIGSDVRGEGVFFGDWTQSFHERNGCGENHNSYTSIVVTVTGGNSNQTVARAMVIIDDNDDEGIRSFRVKSTRRLPRASF